MKRKIKHSENDIQTIIAGFGSWLRTARGRGGDLSFKVKATPVEGDKANLSFTGLAFAKMKLLVSMFDSEVAWHGTVRRVGDKSDFLVTDIMLYPQEVTGVTVNTDQEAYEKWLYSLSDEEFNSNRFQGHSHVNMGTTPSPTDIEHQNKILDTLRDDDFYIFVIWNKKGDHFIKIFDLLNNIVFDTEDVVLKLEDDESGIHKLYDDAKTLVTEHKYTYGAYGYGGYGSYGTGYQSGGKSASGTKTTQSQSTTTQIKQTTTGKSTATKATTTELGYRDDNYVLGGWADEYLDG